jgi:hypothetical protein
MGTEPSCPTSGPVALSALLDEAEEQLSRRQTGAPTSDGFLFSGNRHESVPRALFLDRRLTPLERNAWQVFRLLLNDDGITAFPTYDELRPYLASMPGARKASHETVARALTLLRLTRWLSLVRSRRDPRTGRLQGNLYVLHDEPLTPFEAMQLDADYLRLVSQALTHAAKAVQRVGVQTLKEIAEDPLLDGRTLPTRLQVLAHRLESQGWNTQETYPQEETVHESEEGEKGLLRNGERPSSDSEVGRKAAPHGALRNPKRDRTVRTYDIDKEVRTVRRAREDRDDSRLRLPPRFFDLKEEQQSGALVALQGVDGALRQAVLDEWAARCRGSTVRNPAGYLFGIIQKAIRGEFHASAGKSDQAIDPSRPSSPPSQPPGQRADPTVVEEHIARLQSILRKT